MGVLMLLAALVLTADTVPPLPPEHLTVTRALVYVTLQDGQRVILEYDTADCSRVTKSTTGTKLHKTITMTCLP